MTAVYIRAISEWVNEAEGAPTGTTLDWVRVAKVAEEAGEAVSALILATGGNPRKPVGTYENVIKELLDTAVASLGAVEHLTGNQGESVEMMIQHSKWVAERAGVL